MHPPWFNAIAWTPAIPIEVLRKDRARLPALPGVYVFTSYPGPLDKNFGVLYVGKATNLSSRVQTYLTDPGDISIYSLRSATPKINTSLNHVGKVRLLVEIQQKYRDPNSPVSFIWVRWVIQNQPEALEKQVIQYLQPKHNERLRT